MDPENLRAKFEVRSFTRSWNNGAYLKTLGSRWIRRSRLFKVTVFGTNRKRVCEFLLVHNSNLGPISCTVLEILQVFCAPEWPHPYSTPILGCSRCTRSPMLGSARAEALRYLAVKLFSKNSNLCDHGTWTSQTDGQTDGQYTIAIPRFALKCIAR